MTRALSPLVDGALWSSERPVWFSGVRLRARTTVVRLEDGGLLLHSPAPPTDAMVEELAALGPVRWLVVPNCFHHLGTPAAAARFPDAKIVAPASIGPKSPTLTIHRDIRDPALAADLPELEALPLLGVPFLDETLLYHRPTRTLLGADVVLRARPEDHWTWRFAARIMGCHDRLRVPPDVKHKLPDKRATADSLRAVLERPAERLVVAHADVVEAGCRDRLAEAWRLEGVDI